MKREFIIRNDETFNYFNGFKDGKAIFVPGVLDAKTFEVDLLSYILYRLEKLGFTWLSVKSVDIF